MTACLFKVETERGWVLGLYTDKKSAKQCRNGFGINEEVSPGTWVIVGYSATIHRGPGHRLGETGVTRHDGMIQVTSRDIMLHGPVEQRRGMAGWSTMGRDAGGTRWPTDATGEADLDASCWR